MYIVSLFIIIFAGYREYSDLLFEYNKLKKNSRVARLQTLLVEMINVHMLLEQEADRVASEILGSDNPSYLQGMEQAFRESKIILNSRIKRHVQIDSAAE